MIQICRAEDGEVFQVSATLRDIERRGSLELFLHQEIGVDQDAVLAYLSDGTRLRTDNIRELVGAHDQTIYVFNKYYLDIDMSDVLRELRVEPPLQPPIEEVLSATPPYKPSQLAAQYLRSAHAHLEHITHTLATLHRQHQAVQIACSSLDLNVLSITDVFDGIASTATKDLERQGALLAGIGADLEIINRVEVHVEFMSPTMRKAIENGEKPRTLGTYVARDRMTVVADGCARTHSDLRTHFSDAERAVTRLTSGTDIVRSTVAHMKIIGDAEASGRRFHDAFDKASEIAAALESPAIDADSLMQELKQLDGVLRREVEVITRAKNEHTEQCMGALRRISTLNIDLVQLPTTLSQLQTKFRSKNSFLHIQRLHSMLYAYGATVIEIVRRKEFARFFYQRAQSILEVMAKLSANERKRRQVYRSEVHGQLPFDARGMEDPVPTIDFSPSGSKDFTYSLEREDVDAFLQVVHDLEDYARSSPDPAALGSVQEARFALEKLVQRMDNLEAGFDRIAERSLLSASRLSASRRRPVTEADELVFQELSEQLRKAEEAKVNQEKSMQQERTAFQAEIHRLNADLQNAQLSSNSERERADALERELHQARAQIESEGAARRILERRNGELAQDLESQRRERAKALADATEQAKVADTLRQELAQVRAQTEEVKALEARNAANVAQLLEDQTATLRNLEEARSRGEDLEVQIRIARAENDQSDMEKDRLLRAQATEHDQADGDRAVLEHQFSELREQLEGVKRQLKEAHSNVELTNADAMGLREELQPRHVERLLRDDLAAGRASQSDFEQSLENSARLLAQMLDALSMAQAYTIHPNVKQGQNNQSMVESAFPPTLRHDRSIIDHFLDAIAKTGTIIRKWQKQCKEYRERAKGKISFRNFAKGDLALFLPTSKLFSFPHYFLLATGHLAEQLKTREWIVARITSITERVVDHKDPSSDGIKYYMLEVEDWTQSGQINKRRPNPRKVSAVSDPESERKNTPVISEGPLIPPGPPQAEVGNLISVTQPPTSHLFPTRPRANSTPSAATSESPPEIHTPEVVPPSKDEPSILPHPSSPLRPGSRASRASTASRFSSARLPALAGVSSSPAAVKAVATTALTEHTPVNDTGAMSTMFLSRRRTNSHYVSRSSPLGSSANHTSDSH
ncbi:putative peripheral membrane protein [Melanogaster broomeanus]|nr:putative peripheral membrane protein [Melanogaster broomeanus]